MADAGRAVDDDRVVFADYSTEGGATAARELLLRIWSYARPYGWLVLASLLTILVPYLGLRATLSMTLPCVETRAALGPEVPKSMAKMNLRSADVTG